MKKIGASLLAIFTLFSSTVFGLSNEEIQDAYYKSYIYEQLQDNGTAIDALTVVAQVYPEGYTVNLRLGWLYYLNKNYANSLHHYTIAMKASPDSIEAKLGYTYPLLAQDKFEQVESIVNKVLQADYYNYYGNLTLVYVLRKQEKYELAESVCRKMLTLFPTNTSFLVELALAVEETGDRAVASGIFGDVLILDPENPTAKTYLEQN
ncbi:MAG: tetratricopeptide (TPR) repeat protein [Chlamydiales bacterium]|jgi:tetratricopeptide (TPR) repeat protein